MDNIISMSIWQQTLFSNYIWQYVFGIGIFIGLLIVLKLFQLTLLSWARKWANKTTNNLDDTLVKVLTHIKFPVYLILAFYGSMQLLTLPEKLNYTLSSLVIITLVYQAIITINVLIDYLAEKYLNGQSKQSPIQLIKIISKITLWALGILLVLSNIGINITSLITGLGIGGIAIALAVQNILGDLLSSFAIYFDKPFEIGDYIVIGEDKGTVEKIGIKTTRLRTPEGQQLVVSNHDITSARIHNYKNMKKRRITFTFGVTYETPVDKLKNIPDIVKNIFAGIDVTELDRVHFKELADFSLNYEVVYYMLKPEYPIYMATQQEINLTLMEKFAKEKIEFAFPTQTIIVQK